MNSIPWQRRLFGMAIFLIVAVGLMFMAILPLSRSPAALPGPDLLLVWTLIWVIRRPDYVPLLLIAGTTLLADLLLMRAPGLTAAALALATEYLKRREDLTREVSFLAEWTVAVSVVAMVLIGTSSVLVLSGAPAPGLGALLFRILVTAMAYPVMAVVARYLFGVRRVGRQADFGMRPVR